MYQFFSSVKEGEKMNLRVHCSRQRSVVFGQVPVELHCCLLNTVQVNIWIIFVIDAFLFLLSPTISHQTRTLGGNPSIPPPSMEAISSQVLPPAALTSPHFYPETWINMDPVQDFIQVPVSKEDKSYRTIYNLFHKTVPETKYRILKILRVQNQFLWEKYKRWANINANFINVMCVFFSLQGSKVLVGSSWEMWL